MVGMVITSKANPKIKQIMQWQAKAKERKSAGIFLAEGFKMYEEAPEEAVREVYVSEGAIEKAKSQSAVWNKLGRTGYETVADEVFRGMSDTQTPQGILCIVKRPEYSLEQLLQTKNPLLMVLENLQDPGNLGTIIRTGEGAGITGVIASGNTVDVYNPKTIRATMGSVYRVPFVCEDDLEETVKRLREQGIHAYAAHLAGEKDYDELPYQGGTAFLVGNEGSGLSKELSALADDLLKIPMKGKVESLNVSVAAALLMYEAFRQRKGGQVPAKPEL